MPVRDLWHHTNKPGKCPHCPKKQLPTARHSDTQRHRWKYGWVDPDGTERAKTFPTEGEAKAFGKIIERDLAGGNSPDRGKITVKEFGDHWLDRRRQSRKIADSTLYAMEQALRTHVYPFMGKKRLADVDSELIQDWVNHCRDTPIEKTGRPMMASTLDKLYGYVAAMFQYAEDTNRIDRTPCRAKLVERPDVEGKPRFPLRWDDVEKVSAAFAEGRRPRYAAIPLLAAATGLREAELWALEPHHIDWDRQTIDVVQQLKWLPGFPPYLGWLKSKSRDKNRSTKIQIPKFAVDVLRDHMAAFPPVEVGIAREDAKIRGLLEQGKATLIFTTQSGRPIDRSTWSRVWNTAARKGAGLPERFSLHDLRHFHATVLRSRGIDVKEVQNQLGHGDPTITDRIYYGDRHDDDRDLYKIANELDADWQERKRS